jgi:hypothetical protein
MVASVGISLKKILPLKKEKKHNASFYFKYPSLGTMKKMTPKERVSFIDNKFQKDLLKIKAKLNGQTFQLLGTTRKPRGIKIKASTQTVKKISKLPFINVSVTEGRERKKSQKINENSYFCFKVTFQIQTEGKKKGIQTIEDRFILVKADDWDKAETKVKKEFNDYEKPYLNSYGEMVRWKFDSIEETFHTIIRGNNDFNKPVEVFSKLRTRRLKKDNIWSGE